MRTALNSPFLPGSDLNPEVWAGRVEQLSDWRDIVRPRRRAGLYERGRTIVGEAGLGKSSLVRRIAQDETARGSWVTPQLRIPSGTDPLKLVATAILALAEQANLRTSTDRRVGTLINRVESVAAAGMSLTLRQVEGPEPFTALSRLIIEVGREATRHHDVMVLIHIDEVQNIADENALSQLLIALGDALSHEDTVAAPGGHLVSRVLPVAVYLTGLPEFIERAGAQKGATFARRFKTTTLTAIEDAEIEAALHPFVVEGWEIPNNAGGTSRVFMEQAAADTIIELCHGEPFLFQLAGEKAWYAGTELLITRQDVLTGWRTAENEAVNHVERILNRLPGREREFVETMAELDRDDRTLTRIAADMGFPRVTAAGPTSQRLDTVRGIIRRGKPYTFQHRAVEAFLTSEWPRIADAT